MWFYRITHKPTERSIVIATPIDFEDMNPNSYVFGAAAEPVAILVQGPLGLPMVPRVEDLEFTRVEQTDAPDTTAWRQRQLVRS